MWGRRIGALGAAVTVLVGVGTAALADVTVQGDPTAWAEIITAYRKLNALPGYRIKSESPSENLAALSEVVPGKAFHTVIQEEGFTTLETVTVGTDSRYRFIFRGQPGMWQCETRPVRPEPDPTDLQGLVKATRGAETSINRTPVRAYTFSHEVMVEGRPTMQSTTVYVGTQTGLPRRSVEGLVIGPYILDYYDYGAKIDIALPDCR